MYMSSNISNIRYFFVETFLQRMIHLWATVSLSIIQKILCTMRYELDNLMVRLSNFTFEINKKILISLLGLTMLLYTSLNDTLCSTTNSGFKVYIHNPNLYPFVDNLGYNIPAGDIVSFSIIKVNIFAYKFSVSNIYYNYINRNKTATLLHHTVLAFMLYQKTISILEITPLRYCTV